MQLSRRHILSAFWAAGITAGGGARAFAEIATGKDAPFNDETVVTLARRLSAKPYEPMQEAPKAWRRLSFDQYRDIRFKTERAAWRNTDRLFEAQFIPTGYGFRRPIQIHVVEDGQAKKVPFRLDDFHFGPLAPPGLEEEGAGYAGFRLHAPLNQPDYYDEAAVFHGASYFRAVARDQAYGLSARGLAIDTLTPGEEEFPDFETFWIERPATGARSIRVHALLNSRSVTGAFRFDIAPGDETVFDVAATLFPRENLTEVGIAPLTSMFYFNAVNRGRIDDYRPAAHDSNGLLMATGAGQRLWRPLMNHDPRFEVSAFVDRDPKGFGLIQRARDYADFADLALEYERRPSLWIEPKGDWGQGHVILVEIPVNREDVDNIVAYWRPDTPMVPGQSYSFEYRMTWCDEPTFTEARARVISTRTGPHHEGGRLFVIDFGGLDMDPATLRPEVWSSTGEIHYPVVQANPHHGGVRLFFGLRPGDAATVELGATLLRGDAPVTETWLFRWTKI